MTLGGGTEAVLLCSVLFCSGMATAEVYEKGLMRFGREEARARPGGTGEVTLRLWPTLDRRDERGRGVLL